MSDIMGGREQTAQPVPPGWYPDPAGEHPLRYWDGGTWTDRVRSETAPPPPADPEGVQATWRPSGHAPLEDTGRAADIVATAGAFLLVTSAFLPWYGAPDGFTLSGWDFPAPNFSRVAAIAGLAAGVLALLSLLSWLKPASFNAPVQARARGLAILVLGSFSLVLILVKATEDELFPGLELERRYGFVPAIVGTLVLIGGAVLTLMSRPPEVVPRDDAPVNGTAVASVVLGGLGVLGGILSIFAVILGLAAKSQIDARPGVQRGRGLALTGIVLGFVGVASIIATVLILAAL